MKKREMQSFVKKLIIPIYKRAFDEACFILADEYQKTEEELLAVIDAMEAEKQEKTLDFHTEGTRTFDNDPTVENIEIGLVYALLFNDRLTFHDLCAADRFHNSDEVLKLMKDVGHKYEHFPIQSFTRDQKGRLVRRRIISELKKYGITATFDDKREGWS